MRILVVICKQVVLTFIAMVTRGMENVFFIIKGHYSPDSTQSAPAISPLNVFQSSCLPSLLQIYINNRELSSLLHDYESNERSDEVNPSGR